jgi:hypothetical protein
MADPKLEQSCTLLLTYRRLFERLAAGELYAAMLLTTDHGMSPFSPFGSKPGEGERRSPPLPLRLIGKPLVDDWITSYATSEIFYDKILFYFGDGDSYREYRAIAGPAARALLGVLGDPGLTLSCERLLETAGEFALGERHLWQLGGSDDVTLWTLAVHDLIDAADQGSGTLMERLARPDEPQGVPEAPWDLSGARKAHEIAARRYGTVVLAPVSNLFVGSVIAIDGLLQELRPDAADGGPETKKGILGLTLDEKNRRVSREGYPGEVEFGGKNLAWSLMSKLFEKGNDFIKKDEIKQIWSSNDNAITDEPLDSTIQAEISKLRGLLKPLSVGIKNNRGGGYRLIDLTPGTRPPT